MAKLTFDTYGNEKQKTAFKYLLGFPEITEIGYGGAAGGGKSYTGVSWQWMMCNKYPGYRGFLGRQELKRLKQTTLATYFKFLGDYEIPEQQKGTYNAQDSVIKFINGSEILLLDLAYLPSDPLYTRFGSLELTGGYIDESAEIDEQCISILSTRVGRWKNEEYGIAPKIMEGFNPDKGHVYRRYYKAHKDGVLPNYRVFIPALATDNKRLPKSYIEQLEKTNEVTKQRLLYGNFEYDDTPGRLFDYNALLSMWDNIAINGEKFISCDVARKGKDQSIFGKWNGLELYEVKIEPISNLNELSNTIKLECQKDTIAIRNVIVDENGVGGGVIDNLLCQGFINNASPIHIGKKNISNTRNYDMLKTQCYFKLSEYVNSGKIKISVNDSNFREKLIEELDIIVEIGLEKDSKISIIKKEDIIKKLGRSPDYADMLMMRMFYELFPSTSIIQEEQDYLEINPYNSSREGILTLDEIIFAEDEEEILDIDDNVY